MSMTKRHFEAIAEAVAAGDGVDDYKARRNVARRLADYFEEINPRFDRAVFLLACGVTE